MNGPFIREGLKDFTGPAPAVEPVRDGTESSYIRTYTGRKFWPLNPKPEDVSIHDIAHALSLKCRYQGHPNRFYSVAEHCVRLSWLVSAENKLAALLHDAGEAYLPDVPRPIKPHLPGYKEIERRVDAAIFERYNLPFPWAQEISDFDTRILNDEMMVMLPYGDGPYGDGKVYDDPGRARFGWPPSIAEETYIYTFRNLTRRLNPVLPVDLE